jgi:hypothetical protein
MESHPENIIPPAEQPSFTNMVPPPLANIIPIPGNMTNPPTSIGVVQPPAPTNLTTLSSPTNVIPPPPQNIIPSSVPFVSNIPLQPLGPAPAQLPPLVHPIPPIVLPQLEPIVPIQTQFETLTLNSPLEPISTLIPQPSIGNDLTQGNHELSTTQELVDGNSFALSSVDANAIVNSNGQESLTPEEGQRGMYSK